MSYEIISNFKNIENILRYIFCLKSNTNIFTEQNSILINEKSIIKSIKLIDEKIELIDKKNYNFVTIIIMSGHSKIFNNLNKLDFTNFDYTQLLYFFSDNKDIL